MTRDEALAGVRDCLASALDVSADSIQPSDRIIGDLGADSLDLLDITFQLEQRFRISIDPREIERRAKAVLGETPFEIDGVYTPEALAELRKALPEIPAEELTDGLTVARLWRSFRVETMLNRVMRSLEERSG